MSLSQTYFIASSARAKLGKEACRPDHNLRLLVGHANLLDTLMLELRDAEREQEAWFNHSVKRAQKAEEQPQHIQWADTIMEDEDEEDDSSDSDSESDFDEADFEMAIPLRRLRSPPVTITSQEIDSDEDDDEDMYEDLEDSPELALTRTSSHPPELITDSDSEDDSTPTTPPQPTFEFDEKTPIIDMTLSRRTKVAEPNFTRDTYHISHLEAPLIEAY
jgi:hypothetical protein